MSYEKYTNDCGKECYRGVTPDTPFAELEFHDVPNQIAYDLQWALHTDMGSLTVLDRMTGSMDWDGHDRRDIETGYRDPDGKFWLASGGVDVRESNAQTLQEAIEWVKVRANTCIPEGE